jgi:ATP-dependent helicase/nuclease subunit B
MRNHPIIVFISSIFALREYGYKNEDFISFLKTGLLEIFEDEKEEQFIIDKFEHELFRRGVNKRSDLEKNWEAFDENDDSEKILLEKFNKIKNFLIKKDSKIQKFIKTPSLENFIEIMKLTEKRLNNITDNLIKEGNNEKADEYFMAFNKVKDIAREYQGIYEDKEEYFIELFETGLKEASFKTVPQGLERIEIANYDLVRPREKKIIFAVGLIQENFPKLKKNQSILSDKEIEKLNEICKEKGIEDGFTNYKKENGRRALYTATLLFSSAQEKLFLSYPKIYEEKEAGESKFIKVLKDELKIKTIKKTFVNEDNADIKQVASEKNLLKDILELSRRLIKKEKLKKENYFWINLYKLLIKKNKDIREFFRGLDGEELGVKKISNESIEKIYPNIIYASVSRFETFFQCNYRYFLENTLQIKEIEKLNLDSRVLGNYVHKVLEKVFNEHMQFEDFNKNLLAAMENIGKEYEKYFSYSANNKYLYLQYKNILMASKNIFTKQIEKNIFPIETEFSFGNHNDECRPLIFDVENKKLEVRGYIDRIDRIDGNLGAVDYKIGQKDFNKDEAMDGLQLQLLTYLDVIKNYKKYNSNLWGAAYMQVKERDILFKDLKDDISLKNAMEQIDKKSNLSGIFVYDNLHNLDDLKEIYNIGSFKKDGTPYKNNKRVTSNDDLNILLARNRENLIYAGEKIAKGEVEINPVAKIKKTGEVENLVCEYCPFNAICGFEKDIHKPRILGNR